MPSTTSILSRKTSFSSISSRLWCTRKTILLPLIRQVSISWELKVAREPVFRWRILLIVCLLNRRDCEARPTYFRTTRLSLMATRESRRSASTKHDWYRREGLTLRPNRACPRMLSITSSSRKDYTWRILDEEEWVCHVKAKWLALLTLRAPNQSGSSTPTARSQLCLPKTSRWAAESVHRLSCSTVTCGSRALSLRTCTLRPVRRRQHRGLWWPQTASCPCRRTWLLPRAWFSSTRVLGRGDDALRELRARSCQRTDRATPRFRERTGVNSVPMSLYSVMGYWQLTRITWTLLRKATNLSYSERVSKIKNDASWIWSLKSVVKRLIGSALTASFRTNKKSKARLLYSSKLSKMTNTVCIEQRLD